MGSSVQNISYKTIYSMNSFVCMFSRTCLAFSNVIFLRQTFWCVDYLETEWWAQYILFRICSCSSNRLILSLTLYEYIYVQHSYSSYFDWGDYDAHKECLFFSFFSSSHICQFFLRMNFCSRHCLFNHETISAIMRRLLMYY